MEKTPETNEPKNDSVRAEDRLNGLQVGQILEEHGLTRDHWFHRSGIDYDYTTDTWSANDLLAWLGY